MKHTVCRFSGVCLLAIIGLSLYGYGCSGSVEQSPADSSLDFNITEPVARDFDAIKEDGVLRMITRYSSNTYFLHQGIEWGFEYEFVRRFAEEHDLGLEVVIIGVDGNPYDLLNSGKGDLIAGNYTKTPERKRVVDFTRPYNLVNQVLVYSDNLDNPPRTVAELARSDIPVTIRSNSSYYHHIQDLQKKGMNIAVNLVANEFDTESLLFDVSQHKYQATIADDNIFQASAKYMQGLVQGPTIAKNDTIAWAIRKNAPQLKKELNDYLYDHFQFRGEDRKPKRSFFLDVLRDRYFEDSKPLADYYNPNSGLENKGVISPYDDIIKSVADSAGLDWLMVASIIAQETKFNPRSKSWAGAMGLMQILPRYSEVEDSTLLYDEEINLREGVRILSEHLDHYSYMDSTNQWAFSLAAYNAGQGHLGDARRLAMDQYKNPNEWKNVADALLKLMHRTYYRNARHGFCRGIETVRYVREIRNRYEIYKNVLAMKEMDDQQSVPGVLGIFNLP
ncbi:transglycosylase SLT domain-containing protein [Fodinibius sediminis]|uniref:Membrane-bound lytic murein transglycosylase F n=1 Tax=Fodinibius sediminis TaxID=1214077 RepID=A0A521CJX3_9BACT|nr:transporter substrate-binding domain-containing protein [Fodinibius sediminis]SMO59736.1 membrane-bound lytic murein transglycosylase F [Fodinibius sediminis]